MQSIWTIISEIFFVFNFLSDKKSIKNLAFLFFTGSFWLNFKRYLIVKKCNSEKKLKFQKKNIISKNCKSRTFQFIRIFKRKK